MSKELKLLWRFQKGLLAISEILDIDSLAFIMANYTSKLVPI